MKTNDSNEQVLGSFSQYTGLAKFKVVAVNPTKEELEAMGYTPKDEPEYEVKFKDKEDPNKEVERTKISFYVEGNNIIDGKEVLIKSRIEFLMGKGFDIASTGTPKIVNRLGNFTYSKGGIEGVRANEKMKWFMHEPIRQAYIGEDGLLLFVREWMNLGTKDDGCLDTIEAIVNNGDLTELRNLLKERPTNEVIVLLGVKEDGEKSYQTVYSKCYGRPTAKNVARKFSVVLNEEYGEFKADWGNSFDLKEFVSKPMIDKPDGEAAKASGTSDFA